MSVLFPVPDKAASEQQITIEDVPYTLLLTWNERAGAWSFGLLDRDGLPIVYGRRVVLQLDLLSGLRHLPGLPTGGVFALDQTGKIRKLSREDLVTGRAILTYIPQAELDAL